MSQTTLLSSALLMLFYYFVADEVAESNEKHLPEEITDLEIPYSVNSDVIDPPKYTKRSAAPSRQPDTPLNVTIKQNYVTKQDGVASRNNNALQNSSGNSTTVTSNGIIDRVYKELYKRINKFLAIPKIAFVVKSVGTCIVNGFMEIASYYLPAPLLPLVASLAGIFIPFEPVVQLRRRNPVDSYRRALNSAVTSFMGTFEQNDVLNDDPYMTRRFMSKYGADNQRKEKKRRKD